MDLKDTLKDAHAYFFLLTDKEVRRLHLWEILPDALVIDRPSGAPMRKTLLGYIPTITGDAIYEIEGEVNVEQLPQQMRNTVRMMTNLSKVRRVNRRSYPRYSFTPPVEIRILSIMEKTVTAGKLINLSASGLRAETMERLSPKETYKFHFEIELDDEIHTLSPLGSIVYELPLKPGYIYGVKFRFFDDVVQKTDEAPIEGIGKTVDLMTLVNRLLVNE